ncbi:MAG TPA: hypothetical protein DDX98_01360 [Bacteroidales bacterium]|nr:hypothetical protein [Bacteroidales bacterium]
MAGFAISPLHERNEYRRIRLVNYISLISAASDIVFITFYSLIGFQELRVPIFILILAFPVFFIPILLNRYKYFLAAKLLIVSFNTLLTTLIAIFFFGPDPGIHVFLLIFGFIPLFVWSYKQWFYIVVFFTLNLVLFITIEFVGFNSIHSISFPEQFISSTRGVAVLFSYLGASVAIVAFHALANRKEKLLHFRNSELVKSNAVRSKIFSVISHDLRSPVSSMTNLLKLLNNDYDKLSTGEKKSYITGLSNSAESTYALLENLLDWSRLQSGTLKPNREILILSDLIDSATEINSQLLSTKHLSFIKSIPKNHKIIGDKHMVSTIIRNLISNAIKFTPENGSITVASKPYKGNNILVTVSDTGIGLSKEEIEQLMNSEINFVKPGTGNERGSGLGLLLCKEFVEPNKGGLIIESEVGLGSTFGIFLPNN